MSLKLNLLSVDCPTHCETCTDDETCQTCETDYGIYNNLCVTCPDKTYLDETQICEGMIEFFIC